MGVVMGRMTIVFLAVLLAGCGESTENTYQRGYEEGYNAGQYDVCTEISDISPGLKSRLRGCRGY